MHSAYPNTLHQLPLASVSGDNALMTSQMYAQTRTVLTGVWQPDINFNDHSVTASFAQSFVIGFFLVPITACSIPYVAPPLQTGNKVQYTIQIKKIIRCRMRAAAPIPHPCHFHSNHAGVFSLLTTLHEFRKLERLFTGHSDGACDLVPNKIICQIISVKSSNRSDCLARKARWDSMYVHMWT
jgi:hypothetical protein